MERAKSGLKGRIVQLPFTDSQLWKDKTPVARFDLGKKKQGKKRQEMGNGKQKHLLVSNQKMAREKQADSNVKTE